MITYEVNRAISAEQLADLFKRSTIKRPHEDTARLTKMIEASPLLITAWDGEHLTGAARSLTDFSYCCYLSDLAVDEHYQQKGIGRELIERTREEIGVECSLILLSSPAALDYYPKVGFKKANHAYYIQRKQ
ncbi:GNAT family N-acetyltransferase [Alkalihalophilus marmarensis]|jgi:GNAT superfamily N-acetyltransferase|uniref:GCN5 family N-acetyltransferase n=1 Tax=Alkalihalophilus marmarensis DSM 21297 TaxID=1188261 RepID=U6SPK2_9BACI|nr:GNAT family N-acetyltransferase [Alkalihalophilus marmarensis]ERN53312.1 GCN5 family N-acetyltransferase [Alkalihalophilus marmarensis DSM 21297]MCM3489469.1 GNAT family N-acetyltransferase [Alkalihalophilus marmarensis]